MPTALVTRSTYRSLVSDLRTMIDEGREAALQVITDVRIKTYWKIGRRLDRAKNSQVARGLSPARSELIQALGEDLHLDPSVLYRSLKFYRTYKEGVPKDSAALAWTAHLELLPIKDPKERAYYMKRAVKSGWTRDHLRQAIRSDLYQDGKAKQRSGIKKLLLRPKQGLHTYLAIVEKVVDGDTLICRIDLGFDVWKTQRIRLRAIDTPEAKSAKGKKATVFVERELAKVEFVVLKTYQVDMYYRYVADVFYHPTLKRKESVFSEGKFLNEELLKKGHATLVF